LVETIAGTGDRGYAGDGGPATEAVLNLPVATAFDAAGRMFISDQANQRIRVVGTDGIIRLYAGNGRQGFSGDGGPATEARLYAPVGQAAQPTGRIALDAVGNLYIADTYNHRVRMVDTNGIITTVAGTGSIGLDAGGFSGDDGPAVSAVLSSPSDVAVDSEGNLFIADSGNHCIRRVDANGIITTLIGQPQEPGYAGDSDHPKWARMKSPSGIGLDDRDNLYIADTFNHRLRVAYKGIVRLE
jgi:sugar lactone lactonase YvrE